MPRSGVAGPAQQHGERVGTQQEEKPRWKRAMGWVENALGEAVGELYVGKFFGGECKAPRLHDVRWAGAPPQRVLPCYAWRVWVGVRDSQLVIRLVFGGVCCTLYSALP